MAALPRHADENSPDRDRMVERWLPLADNLARRYAHTSEPLDDLTQVARLGLLKAVDRWDPERGTAFSSFAVPTILGELRRHFRDKTWAVRPPRELQELYLRIQRVREDLVQELNREPTAADVAQRLARPVEDIVEAMAAGDAHSPRSLDVPVRDGETDGATQVDQLADSRSDVAHSEARTALWQLAEVLDDREREVLRLRVQEDLTQQEIGERLGYSQMHVSRIIRGAFSRLQAAAEESGQAARS